MIRFSFSLPKIRWPTSRNDPAVDIESVEVHEIETAVERRARTLKHLLKANHANHSVIYHELRWHNHCPHILGSAYLLGSTSEQLTKIYEDEAKELEPWKDSPGEITEDDWREYLGKREYQRAFVDFFEDQLVLENYEWRKVLDKFLFEGKEPLINGIVSGLAHPLIHLGYALELSCPTIAIEALALSTCFYSFLHKYLDDPSYTKPPPTTPATSRPRPLLDILTSIRDDKRFDDLFDSRGSSLKELFEKREDAVLEHWNAWDPSHDPKAAFEDSQRTAIALLRGTHKDGEKFDFFLVHLLTSSHAVRIILPLVERKWHLSIVRQWWLFVVGVYITQLRPKVDVGKISDYDVKGRDWKWVVDRAVNGDFRTDAHFVKACRAMKVAAETWGDEDRSFLKAAVKFSDEFNHWGGFDTVAAADEHGIANLA